MLDKTAFNLTVLLWQIIPQVTFVIVAITRIRLAIRLHRRIEKHAEMKPVD